MPCKFSLIFMGLFLCFSAQAENVCVKDGTYIGLLKKNVNAVSDSDIEYSSANKEWKINFDYKTITGIASCYNTSGSFGTETSSFALTTTTTGQYCWCKMEPVANYNHYTGMASFYVYLKNYSNNTDCAADDGCAKECAYAIAYNYDTSFQPDTNGTNTGGFRHKLFNTIGTAVSAQNNNPCASGYVNLVNVSSSSFADLNSGGTCDSGYYTYDVNAYCKDGYKWINSNCERTCPYSGTETITLSGQTVTLYALPQTEKYLTVLYSGGRCYVSMDLGASNTDGVNVIVGNGGNDNTYHTID